MEIVGKIDNINLDFSNPEPKITLSCKEQGKVMELFEKYRGKENLSIKIDEKRNKRSLDANSYLWILCHKIAGVLKSTKEEIYINAIKQVGVFDFIALTDKAVDKFIQNWNSKGLGWFSEKVDDCKINGCTKVIVYYGSSTYDSKEMSRLIDFIVEDAKSAGIETKTPEEINNLKSLWGQS